MQREKRQENNDNHGNRRHQRCDYLGGRSGNQHTRLFRAVVFLKAAIHVFRNDNRPIHHHPDGDGDPAQRHQIGADAEHVHCDKRKTYGKRDRQDHNQTGTPAAQEDKHHQRYEHSPLPQRRRDGCGGLVYQRSLIIVGDRQYTIRQACVDFLKALLDPRDDIGCVGAIKFQNQPCDNFAFTIGGCKTLPNATANDDVAQIAHAHGAPVLHVDDNLCEIRDCLGKSNAAHRVLFGSDFEELRPFGFVSAL